MILYNIIDLLLDEYLKSTFNGNCYANIGFYD